MLDLATGDTKRISPGIGKTTCAFFRPGTDEIEFASTHADPKSKQYQDEELAFRASGKERRYSWDYDPEMDIYSYNEKTGAMKRLTDGARATTPRAATRPTASGSSSRRCASAYDHPLTDKEKKSLEENPSNFAEIYIMQRRRLRPEAADQRVRLRRRAVLHAGRQAASSGAASTSRG